MKKIAVLVSSIVGALAVSLHAGPEPATDAKSVPQPAPPPPLYGTGFYMGLDLGANLYQKPANDENFNDFNDEFGDTLSLSHNNDVGFYGGIKAGYVFGTGVFRPTIEADMFYNGWQTGWSSTFTSADGTTVDRRSFSGNVNSGVFLSNFIGRFAFGRFQPYIGAGVGIYYVASPGFTVDTPVGTFNTSGSRTHSDLAWDIVAGADYYFTPKMSTFLEYHYLNYSSASIDTQTSRNLGQSLLGAGLRFHF